MFAKSIVLSDAFLDMPLSARCLYFTLGMLGDDDGFVNSPKAIMRQCGASEDDLRVLLAKKFLIPFESGIVVIKHWRINNYLRSDRYQQTNYLEEKSHLIIDTNNAYSLCDEEKIETVEKLEQQETPHIEQPQPKIETSPVEPSEMNIGDIQKEIFRLIQEHNESVPKTRKIPVSTNFISFVQKESRMLVEKLKNEPPEKIIEALKNFLQVAKSDTWQTTFSWNSFLNRYNEFSPDYFVLSKFLKVKVGDDDTPSRRPQDVFYYKMRDNPRFNDHIFRNHFDDWLIMRPEGEDYFKWQAEWERKEASDGITQ